MDGEVFNEVSDAVMSSLVQYVDEQHSRTGQTREVLCIEVGKALTVLGCTFIGNVLELDAGTAIGVAEETVKRLGAIAVERKRKG